MASISMVLAQQSLSLRSRHTATADWLAPFARRCCRLSQWACPSSPSLTHSQQRQDSSRAPARISGGGWQLALPWMPSPGWSMQELKQQIRMQQQQMQQQQQMVMVI
jgi:hypothetical protein